MYTLNHKKGAYYIRESLLFDHHFRLSIGTKETGIEKGLILFYTMRVLHLEVLLIVLLCSRLLIYYNSMI